MKLISIAMLTLLAMTGCSRAPHASPVTSEQVQQDNATTVAHSVGYNKVYEVKLSDGTKCAVLSGYYAGGIACNYRTAEVSY